MHRGRAVRGEHVHKTVSGAVFQEDDRLHRMSGTDFYVDSSLFKCLLNERQFWEPGGVFILKKGPISSRYHRMSFSTTMLSCVDGVAIVVSNSLSGRRCFGQMCDKQSIHQVTFLKFPRSDPVKTCACSKRRK